MKIIFSFFLFFFFILCSAQEDHNPYKEAFIQYMNEYIIKNKLSNYDTVYVLQKEIITNNINEKIYLNSHEYNVELISLTQARQKKIDIIFEIMPIRDLKRELCLDIIVSKVEVRKKKIFLINTGGQRFFLKYDCLNNKYDIVQDISED